MPQIIQAQAFTSTSFSGLQTMLNAFTTGLETEQMKVVRIAYQNLNPTNWTAIALYYKTV